MKAELKYEYGKPVDRDCESVSKLVFLSKASHGYESDFMENCREELLVTPLSLLNGPSRMVWINDRNRPVGFTQIVVKSAESCELEALFIHPKFQGKGLGQNMFNWAIGQARNLGYSHLIINSDPGAERFYKAAGAIRTGEKPSGSIPGRFLPQLSYGLKS